MDPQRPYAQLLLPIAKSLKLLRRAQHHRYVDKRSFAKHQAVYAIWQKLAAKNIPACPGTFVCDLFIYPANYYIGLLVDPELSEEELGQLRETAMFEGLLCSHTRGKLVNAVGNTISLAPAIFDYLNENKLIGLGDEPTITMIQLAKHSRFSQIGQAVSFVQMLAKRRPSFSLEKFASTEIAVIANILTVLDRNSGQRFRVDKLTHNGRYGALLDYIASVVPVRYENSRNTVYAVSEW